MVSIVKRNRNGKNHYYLVYSFRENGKTKHIEKFLGNKVPENIDIIKKEFNDQIIQKRWFPQIREIRNNYTFEHEKISEIVQIKELRHFGIRFTHDSNRIEGSSMNLEDVRNVLQFNQTPANKPLEEIYETTNHMKAYENMINTNKDFSMDLILDWHKTLFEQTNTEIAGKIRDSDVFIVGSEFTPPDHELVEGLLKNLFKWYNSEKETLDPTLLSCLFHFRFVSIHPFKDGNGRMSRLAMNFILYRNKMPMYDISYKIRASYFFALERANMKNNEIHFIQFFYKNYLKDNQKYLKTKFKTPSRKNIIKHGYSPVDLNEGVKKSTRRLTSKEKKEKFSDLINGDEFR